MQSKQMYVQQLSASTCSASRLQITSEGKFTKCFWRDAVLLFECAPLEWLLFGPAMPQAFLCQQVAYSEPFQQMLTAYRNCIRQLLALRGGMAPVSEHSSDPQKFDFQPRYTLASASDCHVVVGSTCQHLSF